MAYALEYQDNFLNEDNVISLSFDEFSIWCGGDTKERYTLKVPIEFDIPLDFINTERIVVYPHQEIVFEGYSCTLEEVVATPLSIQWYIKRGERLSPIHSDPLMYTFSDGTAVTSYDYTGRGALNNDELEFCTALLDKPVNPSNIASVTIGNYTVDLQN